MFVINDYWILVDKQNIIELSEVETLILQYLFMHRSATLEQLRSFIFKSYNKLVATQTIRTSVHRLRKKTNQLINIKTRNTIGYYLDKNCEIYFIYTIGKDSNSQYKKYVKCKKEYN